MDHLEQLQLSCRHTVLRQLKAEKELNGCSWFIFRPPRVHAQITLEIEMKLSPLSEMVGR